ncbi:DUF3732 domain-containing protein [Sphingopyxis sp. R3-92]|uniref:DUF3732 domain-containing protein n=1 Tax=Sphingopyxis sp. R3-92 TaxID=3158553 RepID=UPI003EE7BF37
MKLHIKRLVIWPQDVELEPRAVRFDLDKISVITGWSGTGKSSIISIIDYVFGAETCHIPVGEIRDFASWYGLEIETDAGPMRVARRKPDGRSGSRDMSVQRGDDALAPLPRQPMITGNVDSFKLMMDTLSGLSDLRLDPQQDKGWNQRASFRDLASFNFLPQHIVANPNTLFFKADSHTHREKLRNVLPLAMGVINNGDLARIHELSQLRDMLRKIEGELKLRRNGLDSWRSNATGAFYRAQELSLLPAGEPPASLPDLIGILRTVVEAGGRSVQVPGRISKAVQRLEELKAQEQQLDRKMNDDKRRLRRLKALRKSVGDFDEVLEEQRAAVHGVGWFQAHLSHEQCALCGSDTDVARLQLEQLEEPITELEELGVGAATAAPMVDADIAKIQRTLLEDERALIAGRRTRFELEREADKERHVSQSLEAVFRFIGSTEQALRMFADVEGDGGLAAQAAELAKRIANLESQSNPAQRAIREMDVAKHVTTYIERFIKYLGIDGADGVPVLDQKELSLRFNRGPDAKPDYLWEIGSGENWMAYHLAALLALQSVFLRRGSANPVPTFLVIDQPSQVYFPSDTFERVVEGRSAADGTGRRSRRLNDLDSTKQIFRALARAQKKLNGALQIIVLDHADQNAWGDLDNVKGIETWRNDSDWLIPQHWINAGSGEQPTA